MHIQQRGASVLKYLMTWPYSSHFLHIAGIIATGYVLVFICSSGITMSSGAAVLAKVTALALERGLCDLIHVVKQISKTSNSFAKSDSEVSYDAL